MQVTAAKIDKAWQQLLVVESADSLLEVALQNNKLSVLTADVGRLENGSITTVTYRLPLQVAGVLNSSRKSGTTRQKAGSPQ